MRDCRPISRRLAARRISRRLAVATPPCPDHSMQQRNASARQPPSDAYERERLDNLHPPDGAIRSPRTATTWWSSAPVRRDWSRPHRGGAGREGRAGRTRRCSAATASTSAACRRRRSSGRRACTPRCAMPSTTARKCPADIRVDFPAVMQRMRRIRARISRVDSVQRLSADRRRCVSSAKRASPAPTR